MLTYTFDNIGNQPLYEALYRMIKDDIMSGKLSKEEHLPSKRSLAANLGISTITVESAYGQLMSEGYIYSLPKRGYFVSDISGFTKVKEVKSIALAPRQEVTPEYLEDFSNNRTNPDSFPFATWAKLMRETITEYRDKLLIKPPVGGVPELRTAIAQHLASFRGMSVSPDQIIVGAGTEYLYGLLIQLLGRDKIYCLENPGYRKISQIYASNGVSYCYGNLDQMGICVQDLEQSGADIAHISPTHHFPTGITMPVNRRYELLAWANAGASRYIIEDDYDSEFRLNGRPIPPLQTIDISEKVIYVNTFSKSLASTMRISYMVLPVHLANRYQKELGFYACTVSNFEQYTLARFIREGYFEKQINRMRLYYARQRKEVLAAIRASRLNKRCEILEQDSGLHFLLRLITEKSDDEILEQLDRRKIHILPVAAYYENPETAVKHTYILNYSNLNMENLPQALDIIAGII